jgi:acyl carrier protein
MDRNAFYSELDELLELPKGTTRPEQLLDKLPEWDSLAVISLIALADSKYNVSLEPKRIGACKTVQDLALHIEEQEEKRDR